MITPDSDNPLTGPFWQAAERDSLVMCWCEVCDRAIWYPQACCPTCASAAVWRELSGRAILLSWTVVYGPINPSFKTPYIPALVVPIEAPGARMVTQIITDDLAGLRCDMELSVQFVTMEIEGSNSFRAPVFAPKNS